MINYINFIQTVYKGETSNEITKNEQKLPTQKYLRMNKIKLFFYLFKKLEF